MNHNEILKNATFLFLDLAERYNALSFDEKRSAKGQKLFGEMMNEAPDELINLFHDKAKEMGLVPDASGYLDNGDPVYSLEDIAEVHGISLEEALEIAKKMGVEAQLVDADKINRIN